MKKIVATTLSILMAATFVSCAKEQNSPTETARVITWLNYEETVDAYVNDYFKYVVPEAYDQDKAEYDVSSKVYDEEGTQIDNVGNMFLVKEEGEYTIEFTAFDGEKEHTAKTVVSAIEKCQYSFANSVFVYGLNEEINLNDKVISTQDGEITYNVNKDGEAIALSANKFTPTQLGSYLVTAKQEKQADFEFSLEVVDKVQYPFPNGMIEDSTLAEQTITATPIYGAEGTKPNVSQINVTHDDTVKFDENSNGSTKVSVVFPDTSNRFELPIKTAPRFSKTYYQTLQSAGYEHVAVRMKVEDVQEFNAYGIFFFAGKSISYKRYNQNGTLINEGTDNAFWSGPGYQLSQYGWFEFLIPMSDFLAEYSENMTLMTFVTYNPGDTLSYYGALDIYIDNIYAVKAFDGESVFEEKNVNDTMTLDELVGEIDDVDELFTIYTVNGERKTFSSQTDVVTFDKSQALYAFEFRARNRFGVAKRTFSTLVINDDEKQVLWNIDNDTALSNISTSVLYANDGSGVYAGQSATITYRSDLACAQVVHSTDYSYSDLIIKPTLVKAYYEQLKSLGYKYVTVSFRFYGGEFKMAAGGSEGGEMMHRNNIYVGNTGLVTVVKNPDGSLTETDFAGAGPWTTNATSFTVSYSIDLFINSYNANGTKILRLVTIYGAGAGVFGNYDFSEIQFTKDGQMMN